MVQERGATEGNSAMGLGAPHMTPAMFLESTTSATPTLGSRSSPSQPA